MKFRICIGALIMGLGCGEVTAEPIRSASLAITSVDVEPTSSEDPYSCALVQVDSDDTERLPIVQLGELAYGSQCTNPAPGGGIGCWHTGDSRCEEAGRDCGGFTGTHDMATGEYTIAGGQHMVCSYGCKQDADCPAPGSGTARVTCMHGPEFDPEVETGQCALACDAGETCPDGFVCIDPGLTFSSASGATAAAPMQCVELHRVTLTGSPYPP
jgi:hypothetical protein